MKKELMDVMYLHTTVDTFIDKHAPREMMPDEYSGSGGKFADLTEKLHKNTQANGSFFVEEEQTKRINENLRPGKPKTESDLFGTDGNFKQLQFD